MKKVLATFALMAIGSLSAFAGEWSGYIADSKCKHIDGTDKSIACTQKCIKGGADAVFVTSDDKVLKIDKASMDKVTPHFGHKVTVTGKVDGETLTVDTIKM
ncbi:MAG TPA: hypothetical protein VNU44_13505 [Bryobacteraceae bacterium]|jgi:hypothetical protein|nr:hypothetical protein [Bryobacteraceae bacterium]